MRKYRVKINTGAYKLAGINDNQTETQTSLAEDQGMEHRGPLDRSHSGRGIDRFRRAEQSCADSGPIRALFLQPIRERSHQAIPQVVRPQSSPHTINRP